MRQIITALALIALAACSRQETTESAAPAAASTTQSAAAGPITPIKVDAPAGAYTLDKAHASLLFRVDHVGFSNYTARFKNFDAQLQFDPNNPAASILTATIDPKSIETDFPDPAKHDFNAQLRSEQWLDTAKFPEMTYRSTKVELTGPNTMRVDGDLTLHGVTRPVPLNVTFNGGYASHPFEPNARVGFSAQGSLKRSEFGMSYGIPEPGSKMGVSDEVEIILEVEFSGPPVAKAQADSASQK